MLDDEIQKRDPDDNDFTTLSSAVDDLSKQTEALLGKSGEKMRKPKLPKPTATARKGGRNFDIIKHPQTNTKLNATLRSVPSKVTKTIARPGEVDAPAEEQSENIPEPSPSQKSVRIEPAHALGELQGVVAEQSEEGISTVIETSPQPSSEEKVEVTAKPETTTINVNEEPVNDQKYTPAQASVHQDLHLTESTEELSSTEKNDTPEVTKSETTEQQPISGPDVLGEVYANNLTTKGKHRGYEAPEDQQKLTVFDTNEYHPELHDWSKLDRTHHTSWFVLALLVVIAGALAFFILSGQKLPFGI